MELVIVLVCFVGLALASVRWGEDSRFSQRDREHQQAFWSRDWMAPPPRGGRARRRRRPDRLQILVAASRVETGVAAPARGRSVQHKAPGGPGARVADGCGAA